MATENNDVQNPPSTTRAFTQAASETVDKASEFAAATAKQAKETISDTAASARDHAKDLFDDQLKRSSKIFTQLAKSTRVAANDMAPHSPFVAGLIERAADKVDEFSGEIEDRTIDHLIYSASRMTRRRPALVFGLAALTGFLVYRAAKAVPPVQARSTQPSSHAGV